MPDPIPPMRLALIAPPTSTVPPSALGGLDMVRWLADGLAGRGHQVTLVGAGLYGLSPDRYQLVDTDPAADPRTAAEIGDQRHAEAAGKVIDTLDVQAVSDHTRSGYLPAADRVATVRTVYAHARAAVGLVPHPGHVVGLVAVSSHQRRRALDTCDTLLGWVDTIAPGIPFAEHPLAPSPDGPCVYLGPVLAGRGIEWAVQAAHQAGRPIVVANTDPDADTMVWAEVKLRPLLGPGDELLDEVGLPERWALLERAGCLVAPGLREAAFCLVAVEAMACGTPVVGLSETVIAEQALHGTSGMLARKVADLPQAIERAARLEPAKVRAQAARRFDAQVMVAGYEALFARLVGADR